MAKERNYGIDLLRLVLMFMVCLLHTLGQGGILKACEVGSFNYKFYWVLEATSICAVDGFALISGYMATDKPHGYEKLADMWFQAFFYSFILTFLFTIVGINAKWQTIDIIKCAFPMTFEKFWYFTAYFALFFVIPVFNKYIFGIDDVTAKKALIVMVILFSCVGIIADPFKTKWGYSAIWLMILYCIGALAKRTKLFETRKSMTLVILWVCCVAFSWAVLAYVKTGRLINYVSPTTLLSAVIMVVLFSRLKLNRAAGVIAKLSPLTFGIYLFQLNQVVWDVLLKDAFVFVADKDIISGAAYVFAFAASIFISGLIVEFVRNKLAACLKISSLSKKIVYVADKLLNKLFVFLK